MTDSTSKPATLADAIAVWGKHRGLDRTHQKDFAAVAGIDQGQLSRYLALERGEPGGVAPSIDNLARIQAHAGEHLGADYWNRLRTRARRPRAGRKPRRRAAARRVTS